MDDKIVVAEEIARQMKALKPHVEGPRGVMAYLDDTQAEKRTDVNKTFLASTIHSVNLHNRRQEEDKCWKLRHLERKLDTSRSRQRYGRRSRSKDRRRIWECERRSWSRTSRSRSRREERKVSRRSRSRDRSTVDEFLDGKKEIEDERSYWARKKAGKVSKLWENLHLEGIVSLENAPDFSREESDDDDVKAAEAKVSMSPKRNQKKQHKKPKKPKKHKKTKKHKKHD
ncbi:unnamed protein product [Peronospora destructor]|uniref:Uncharacterized protein n=1 Tax=Peronospora destructor TaxID=86335 RepID=A0AAV0UME6_9STRA|nr:unnamed protein product [Peronospora destructor]